MLVTAIFAGLLVYSPYELSSKSGFPLTNAAARSLPAVATPPPTGPQDIEDAVPKEVANRIVSQEEDSSAALPDEPATTAAPQPSSALKRLLERPARLRADHTSDVQRVLDQRVVGKRKISLVEDARNCCFEGRKREAHWAGDARDSRAAQRPVWRRRQAPCESCH